MQVRLAEADELPALAQVWHDAWMDGHLSHVPEGMLAYRTLDSFRTRLGQMLDDTRAIGPVGAPLGFCSLKGNELYQMFVHARARGTGAAQTLMADAEARLRAAGHRQVWLSCIIGNDRAARFYRKMGWHLARTDALATLDDPYQLEVWIFEKTLD